MEDRLSQIEHTLQEIKASQKEITNALLGSLEGVTGLIPESRVLRKEMDLLNKISQIHEEKLQDLVTFKSTAKKILGGIAVIVPILFELCKAAILTLWDFWHSK